MIYDPKYYDEERTPSMFKKKYRIVKPRGCFYAHFASYRPWWFPFYISLYSGSLVDCRRAIEADKNPDLGYARRVYYYD